MNFEEEVVKKKNENTAKKKKWLAKLCTSVGFTLFFYPESSIFSLLCSVLTFVPTLMPAPMPALVPASTPVFMPAPVSHPESPAVLLFCCMSAPAISALFSSPRYALISCCGILALLLLLPSIFGPPLCLISSSLKTLNQFLLNELQLHVSTSLKKFFYLFLAFRAYNLNNNNGLYNRINNNKRKWGFNTAFINSYPLVGNHNQELNLSFVGFGCPDIVKLN